MNETKPTRADVKSIFDYLLGRTITLYQANQQLLKLGLIPAGVPVRFLAGELTFEEVFQLYGV